MTDYGSGADAVHLRLAQGTFGSLGPLGNEGVDCATLFTSGGTPVTRHLSHTQPMNTRFVPGTVYYGTLTCAHSDFPVRCVRRTEKSVWFEHVTHPDVYGFGRCKIHTYGGYEAAMFRNWYVSSTKTTGGDFDPLTI